MATDHQPWTPRWVAWHLAMVAGLAVTAASMSSGFIWASQGKVLLVYVAGFFAWTGYIAAHYAAMGVFIDDVSGGAPGEADGDGGEGGFGAAARELAGIAREEPFRVVGFVVGIAVLVAGIAILAWYVRQENHLLGNVGSGLFLGGYVVAHYFDAGVPL